MRFDKKIAIIFSAVALGACGETTTQDAADAGVSTDNQVVENFFEAMAAEDKDAASALLTDDAEVVAPYNPNGDASDAGIRNFPASLYIPGAMQTYDNLVWENRKYSVADDGKTIWVEAEGKLKVAETGKPYENRYVFKIELSDGKIARITEYTNVATLAQSGVVAGAE